MISERKLKKLAKENKREGEPLIKAPIIAACYIGDHLYEVNHWEGDVPVKGDESTEIMLGETKYFVVKKKELNGAIEKIEIVEIPTDYGVEPDFPENAGEGWEWINDDVWGDDPVSIHNVVGKKW